MVALTKPVCPEPMAKLVVSDSAAMLALLGLNEASFK
jgi:hypothetical protein